MGIGDWGFGSMDMGFVRIAHTPQPKTKNPTPKKNTKYNLKKQHNQHNRNLHYFIFDKNKSLILIKVNLI